MAVAICVAVSIGMAVAVASWAAVGVRTVAIVHPIGRRIWHEADVLDLSVHCGLQQGVEFGGFLRGDTRIRDFNGE